MECRLIQDAVRKWNNQLREVATQHLHHILDETSLRRPLFQSSMLEVDDGGDDSVRACIQWCECVMSQEHTRGEDKKIMHFPLRQEDNVYQAVNFSCPDKSMRKGAIDITDDDERKHLSIDSHHGRRYQHMLQHMLLLLQYIPSVVRCVCMLNRFPHLLHTWGRFTIITPFHHQNSWCHSTYYRGACAPYKPLICG